MNNNLFNVELLEAMTPWFDHTAKLYQKHALEDENSILLKRGAESMPEEEKEWRDKIEEGMELDCLKVDA